MGYKKVCLECRKAFNRPINLEEVRTSKCPQCGQPMTELYHLFQPPKQSETKKWEVVKYLVENGFQYHHVWATEFKDEKGTVIGGENYAKYPETMRDALEFVNRYKK